VNGEDFVIVRRPVPYDRYYGREYISPGAMPVPVAAKPMSAVWGTLVGFAGVGALLAGGTMALGGFAHHGGIGPLAVGLALMLGGFSMIKAALKVTDP
jgi:hypothetical protein